METAFKTFEELTNEELYEVLALRSEIFVVEQECIYQDIDGKDKKAYHLFGKKNGLIVAYARIFRKGDYFSNASIGRVLVKKEYRQKGIAHQLMKVAIERILVKLKDSTIELSAQSHLTRFYDNLGFKSVGKEYLEDGIPHIRMIYKSKS